MKVRKSVFFTAIRIHSVLFLFSKWNHTICCFMFCKWEPYPVLFHVLPMGTIPCVSSVFVAQKLYFQYFDSLVTAMSFASEEHENTYKYNLKEVTRMLKTKHGDNYLVRQSVITLSILHTCSCPVSAVGRALAFQHCVLGLIPDVSMWDGYGCHVRQDVLFGGLHISRFLQPIQTNYFY